MKYIPSLDGLRCLAVLLVLFVHGHYGYFKGGWIGVDIFFVLSGYLITNLIQTEYTATGLLSFKKFYVRRALRLFPPLILGVILGNALWPYTLSSSDTPDQTLATLAGLFYFANCISPAYMANLDPLWSLSVEEHFYFIWPLMMVGFVLPASRQTRIIFLVISLLAIATFRVYTYNLAQPI